MALRKATLLAAVAAAACAASATATTQPTKEVTVQVIIKDDGLRVFKWVSTGNGAAQLQTLPGPIPRGDYLSFVISNRGRRRHDFAVFGKKTKPIRPGGTAHLFAAAVLRGSFLYRSTLDRGRSFRGFLVVY